MAISSSGHNGSNTNKANSLAIRVWFALFGGALILWAALYLYSHSNMQLYGYKVTTFSTADIRNINSILISGNTDYQPQPVYQPIEKKPVTNANDGFLDSYTADTSHNTRTYVAEIPQAQFNNFSEEEQKKERSRRVMVYIATQYGSEISSSQLSNIKQYISNFSPKETGVFLSDYRLRVKSFFWLSGALVYAEVVFWVIFGVLCSLLLFTANARRRANVNHRRDILYQTTRLFYAPFAAVIMVLIYSYLKGGNTVNIAVGEGVIVFAFLLGLSSGLMQEMAERLRGNNTVPLGNNNSTAKTEPIMQESLREAYLNEQRETTFTRPMQPPANNTSQQNNANGRISETDQHFNTAGQGKQNSDDNEINEVLIDLRLDFSGLFDDERTQLNRLGFSRAIVTLHNVNGKDIIPAKKRGDDTTTFTAAGVKPGIYIARATLSQRLRDDQIINLFGEKTAYITEDKPGLELYVKKYEAAD